MKKILIIGIFLSFIPITIIILILKDISTLSTILDGYIISGKSLFFPFLPSYNVFYFLPNEAQIIQLSTGHLIDMIIIINLISIVEIFGYHYYKKTCLNKDALDSYPPEPKQDLYTISQDPSIFSGFIRGASFSFDNNLLNNNNKIELTSCEQIYNAFGQIMEHRTGYNFIQNYFSMQSFSKPCYKFFKFLHFHPIFEGSITVLLFYHLNYPQIRLNVNYSNSFQYKGINMIFKAYYYRTFYSIIIKMNYIKKLILKTEKR